MSESYQLNLDQIMESLAEQLSFSKSEIRASEPGTSDQHKSYSYKSVYEIKNLDATKQIFCQNTYLSKAYYQALKKHANAMQKLLNIDI